MERHVVEVIRSLEPGECRHRDKIPARDVAGFAVTLADVRAGLVQEGVGKLVAGIGITNANWLIRGDAVRKVFALIDVKNRVFPHHWDQAS